MEVHLSDLASPVLSSTQRRALESAERNPVELSADKVLAKAKDVTGLNDFGKEDVYDRLNCQLTEMSESDNFTTLAKNRMFRRCVQYICTRMHLEELLKRHPEIQDLKVKDPIIIVGPPRSGTSHLLNILATDSRLRWLANWEANEPIPPLSDITGPSEEDPRYVRYVSSLNDYKKILPHALSMHPMGPDRAAEETTLFLPDFPVGMGESVDFIPRWDRYLAHDQSPHYEYMVTILKALQWLRGPTRWVLKSPLHSEQLPLISRMFPTATIVLTHRDPVAVVQSNVVTVAYNARLRFRSVDVSASLNSWIGRIKSMIIAIMRDRSLIPTENLVDIYFDKFMENQLEATQKIHYAAKLDFTPEYERAAATYIKNAHRDESGRVKYNWSRDFDVEPNDVRQDFSFYVDRYNVTPEVL